MNYCIFVQARLSSSRSPGKVLADIEGKPMLLRQLQRIRHGVNDIDIICVTSNDKSDDPIEELCSNNNFNFFRGSLNNVLQRYIDAADEFNVKNIIRIGGDDPLADHNSVTKLISEHEDEDFLYTSHRSGWPYGTASELIKVSALRKIATLTSEELYKEHIIPFSWHNPDRFNMKKVFSPDSICRPEYYFSVDYEEDLQLIRNIFALLKSRGEFFSLKDVINLCDNQKDILEINKHLHSGFDF